MSTYCTTQSELDAAIAAGASDIIINSPAGAWIDVIDSATVTASGSATVRAYDSATVRASGSATVTAYGSATVRAYDSATVTAYGSATVRASGSATVTAYGSATVRAYGSATVTASGSATVTAYDSATVTASGSATVTAYDSATVTAYHSATVRASGSATVTAYNSATVTASGSATVRASSHVAVHVHSGYATISGGVLIDHPIANLTDPAMWCAYHGVTVTDGIATLHKAVNDNWTTDRGTDYSPGATPEAPDWRDNHDCGNGLHFSPWPWQAQQYHSGATKFVAVGVALADLRPILGGTPKCKAPAVIVACREVTIDGEPIA